MALLNDGSDEKEADESEGDMGTNSEPRSVTLWMGEHGEVCRGTGHTQVSITGLTATCTNWEKDIAAAGQG